MDPCGEILSRIHKAGFAIRAIKSMRLTREEAEGFYAVHRERGFFAELTTFMSSGKIIVIALEAEGAIARWRETMGATDPAKAAPGTVSPRPRHQHSEQLHSRLGRPRDRGLRARLLLQPSQELL